jgi:hypothetical protein
MIGLRSPLQSAKDLRRIPMLWIMLVLPDIERIEAQAEVSR